jgi:hypothetical protein
VRLIQEPMTLEKFLEEVHMQQQSLEVAAISNVL